MTSDQEMRIQILSICEGRVSEAKNAYYWVMTESSGDKSTKPFQAVNPGTQGHQIQNDPFSLGRSVAQRAAEDQAMKRTIAGQAQPSQKQIEALQQHVAMEAQAYEARRQASSNSP